MINPVSTLRRWSQLIPECKHLIDIFISPEGVGRRYLFGCNEYSAELSKAIDIDGFVDDYSSDSIWNGKPVLKGEEVPKHAIIVNCVLCARPITAHKRIQQLDVAGFFSYSDLCRVLFDVFPLPKFVSETRLDIQRNILRYVKMSERLFDDQSKQVLKDVLQFRLTGDYSFMSSYSFRPKDQYWEDFLDLGSNEVFVDAGGYDGDTTEEFCMRYPDYSKVFLFEPSPINLVKAKTRLFDMRDIEYYQLGLSDSTCELLFNPDDGSASSISESGSCKIDVTTLDQKVAEKVTFIKMDLEGWELKTLKGSQQHIIRNHPKLAVSIYHHPTDFWSIFEFVIGLRADYDVYLRHYTEGWIETIMFFVPQ